MTRRVDPAEIYAGVVAFNQIAGPCECDPYTDPPMVCRLHDDDVSRQVVKAVIEAVTPMIEARQRQYTEAQSTLIVSAIVDAAGGQISLTERQLREAPEVLTRWDDPISRAIVFSTKEVDHANLERARPFDWAG